MMTFFPKTHFDFLKYRKVYFTISALIFAVGIFLFATKGLNMGIDFTGGTMVQVKFEQPVPMSQIRQALTLTGHDSELQTYGDQTYAVREKGTEGNVGEVQARIEKALDTLKVPYVVQQTNFVGPSVGQDMTERAAWAIILSLVCIVIYVAFRFNNILWGTSGVIALFHDLFVMAVAFALTQREIDLVVVAAFLTVAGYSINDTIVIFDRIRENMRLNPRASLRELINNSINETLSRTVITSLTVIGALLILYFFGGEALNSFSFAMLVGCTCGVYTTIALTTPLVYVWNKGSQAPTQEAVKPAAEKKVVAKEPVRETKTESAAPAKKSVRKSRRNRR
ncbi:protein translocase subunit SecF [Candidatus Avelusimicrobium facis]|uniref:protein translocase subunit SecF n=1 Tax=Candidatus Avelusimicrobium facis TaxID=3416203 RepID=UPI003D095F9B